ncbi:MAG: hypothetical protein M1822_003343 [Bathelium mastoideum]|nr:MAG: hypothetical protein M1822_003343 [Bathelium mastoideum]
MTIGVAIIGSGIFVRREHLPAVKANPSLTLKAVYSRSLNSAQNLVVDVQNVDLYSEDAGTGKGYKDLLQRPDVQAVIIALPIVTQPSYIREALQAGKHVLAEKPIAKDVATATELLDWYRQNIDTSKVTWCVAENYRFFDSIAFAGEQVKKLGRVLGFNVRVQSMVKPGGAYFETEWRKKPQYQGGFLLDAGIHFVAGLRMLLGTEHTPARVSAFTAQLQQHLPPIDTLDAVIKTKSGATGTISASFGTTYDEYRLSVACEKGVVFREKVGTDFQRGVGGAVVIQTDGGEERTEFASEEFGVKQEINAWSESLELGRPDSRQSPEEAMKDLKMLEAMLWSGEQNGQPVDLSPS